MNDWRVKTEPTSAPSLSDPAYRPLPVPAATPEVSVLEAMRFGLRGWRDQPLNLLMSLCFFLVPIAGWFALSGHDAVTLRRLHARHPEPIAPLRFRDFSLLVKGGFAPFLVRMLAGAVLATPLVLLMVVVLVLVAIVAGVDGLRIALPLVFFAGMVVSSLVPNIAVGGGSLHAEMTGDLSRSLDLKLIRDYLSRCWRDELTKTVPFTVAASLVYVACASSLYTLPLFVFFVPIITYGAAHLRWQLYERYVALGGAIFTPNTQLDPVEPA